MCFSVYFSEYTNYGPSIKIGEELITQRIVLFSDSSRSQKFLGIALALDISVLSIGNALTYGCDFLV